MVKVRVRCGGCVGDDALVAGAGEAVELGLVAQIIGDVGLPRAGENFVDDRAVRALGDEQATQRALGAEGFEHGVAAPRLGRRVFVYRAWRTGCRYNQANCRC